MNIFSIAKQYKQKLNKIAKLDDEVKFQKWKKFHENEKRRFKDDKNKMHKEYVGPKEELQEYINRIEQEMENPVFRQCKCFESDITMEEPDICKKCGGVVKEEDPFREPNFDEYGI